MMSISRSSSVLLAIIFINEALERSEARLKLISLRDVDPLAVCADGTPSGYYWKSARRNAASSRAPLWIVYLQGGDWCWSRLACNMWCYSPIGTYLCSSTRWQSSMQLGGIFHPKKFPALDAANKVYVRYCTADGHMGDASALGGWEFRGARVVQAVLNDLMWRHGLGQGNEKDLLVFGGGSAGARGAMAHLDYVKGMLGHMGDRVDVVGFLDSPLWLDIEPLSESITSFVAQTKSVYSYANVTHLGETCEAAFGKASGWKCMFGEYRIAFLQTPFFLVASQYDSFQLGWNVKGPLMVKDFVSQYSPASPAELSLAASTANKTLALLKHVREIHPSNVVSSSSGQVGRENGVFSCACFNHATSRTDKGFNQMKCDGTTMSDALQQFLDFEPLRTSSKLQWVDSCVGFNCGEGCHGSSPRISLALDKGDVNGLNASSIPDGYDANDSNASIADGALRKGLDLIAEDSNETDPNVAFQDESWGDVMHSYVVGWTWGVLTLCGSASLAALYYKNWWLQRMRQARAAALLQNEDAELNELQDEQEFSVHSGSGTGSSGFAAEAHGAYRAVL